MEPHRLAVSQSCSKSRLRLLPSSSSQSPLSASTTQEKHQLQSCTIDWDALDLDAIEAAAIKSCVGAAATTHKPEVQPVPAALPEVQPVPATLPKEYKPKSHEVALLRLAHLDQRKYEPYSAVSSAKEHSQLKRPRRPCPDSGPGVPGVDFPHEETLNQTRTYFLEGGYNESEVDEILVQKGLLSYHRTAAGKREQEENKKKWQRRKMWS